MRVFRLAVKEKYAAVDSAVKQCSDWWQYGMSGCCDATHVASPQETMGHRIGDASALAEGGRLHVKVQGRYVTVLRLHGELFALDSTCYHNGGPLGLGDIEEVGGSSCLVCPWHRFKVDIKTGDELYQGVEFVGGKMVTGGWARRTQQRAHKAHEHNGGLYVLLKRGPKLPSDQYACDPTFGDAMLQSQRM